MKTIQTSYSLIAKKLEAHKSLEELLSILNQYHDHRGDIQPKIWELFGLLSKETVNKILCTSRGIQISECVAALATNQDERTEEANDLIDTTVQLMLFRTLLGPDFTKRFRQHSSSAAQALHSLYQGGTKDFLTDLDDLYQAHIDAPKPDNMFCLATLIDLANNSFVYIKTLQDTIQAGHNIELPRNPKLPDNPNERAYHIAITSAKILYDHKEYQSFEVITAVDPSIKIDNPELVAELIRYKVR